MPNYRYDINGEVDRDSFVVGVGHMRGFPTRPGESSTATTGVPTNGIAGFGPSAVFHNFKGTVGSALYVNVGTNLSATWVNVA